MKLISKDFNTLELHFNAYEHLTVDPIELLQASINNLGASEERTQHMSNLLNRIVRHANEFYIEDHK